MTTRQRGWSGHVFIATSVDGYIAEPDGDLDWLTDPPAEPRHVPAHRGMDAPPDYDAFTAQVSHLVMGRGTYEKVLTFDPWPYERFRVLVLSTQLPAGSAGAHGPDGPHGRVTVVGSIDHACELLDREQATAVYVDGGEVISAFLARGLIDELTITRAPVLLGAGLPLFHALPTQVRLIHLGTSTTDSGMTTTRYRVAT